MRGFCKICQTMRPCDVSGPCKTLSKNEKALLYAKLKMQRDPDYYRRKAREWYDKHLRKPPKAKVEKIRTGPTRDEWIAAQREKREANRKAIDERKALKIKVSEDRERKRLENIQKQKEWADKKALKRQAAERYKEALKAKREKDIEWAKSIMEKRVPVGKYHRHFDATATPEEKKQARKDYQKAYAILHGGYRTEAVRVAEKARKAGRRAKPEDLGSLKKFYERVQIAKRIRCYWCGKWTKAGERHVDHIVPVSKGGKHIAVNLCCACPKCNLEKRDLDPQVYSGQGFIAW